MSERALKIVLIEDDPDHAAFIKRHLTGVRGWTINVDHRTSLTDGIDRLLQGNLDAVLLDLGLPESRGLETLKRVIEKTQHFPIIVLTALDDLDIAVQAAQHGAQDYLVKTQISGDLLIRTIRYAIERRRTQSDLQHYAQELERSNRDFQDFAHVVSHELKTPLLVISYCFELMRRRGLDQDPEGKRFLHGAEDAARRMTQLINDLLEFGRVGSRGNPIRATDCNDLATRVVAMLQEQIDAAGATVTVEDLPMVPADSDQLMQVLANLIGNALKYHGANPPHIRIRAQREAGIWHFTVADNGIGVPEKDAARIFLIFERLHSEQEYPGTGIGLALCKRIIERHGGEIWVESTPGEGSTFHFTLPIEPSAVTTERHRPAPVLRSGTV